MRIGDLEINRLGFGAMRVIDNDNIWGEPSDRKHAHKVLRRAVELGVNFIDTAESYGPQTDETLIGEALHPYPKGLVIATKCGLARPSPGRWDADCRPEKLRQDLDGSLKRLRVERIDLWQLHTVDPKVQRVIYPGLPNHPQHTLAARQMNARYGGMVTAVLKGGLEASRRFLERCSLFTLAESLGGVESLIEHPAIMTHASLPEDVRAGLGIDDGLVRLSVGIESIDDLIAELNFALE